MTTQIADCKNLIAKLTANRSGNMKSYVAILLVSVGKENFEGEAIASAIKMLNREFKACCIVMADTLQRHNIAIERGMSGAEAYQESLEKGDEWLKRYETYFLNTFTIPYHIVRWDSLINDPLFNKKEDRLALYLKINKRFSKAMYESIAEYQKRLLKRLGNEKFESIKFKHEQSCFAYLKEECAVITLLPKAISINHKLDPLVIVYPGKSTLILTENRELFIKEEYHHMTQVYGDFLNWIPYRLNRIKSQHAYHSPSFKHSFTF